MTSLLRILVIAISMLAGVKTASGEEFPDRPVTVVVPFPPGGSVDGVARILAQELSTRSGKSFVVENRAGGAGGSVGATSVLRANPDGYTLLFNASIHVVTPLINSNIRYDVVNDFTHVAGVAAGPLLITTHPSVQAGTLREFFDALKEDPKRYTIATTGLGSAGHLTVEFLKQKTGVDAPVVVYRGGGPALNDMVGGHVHLLADPMFSSLPYVQAGKLKPLAVTATKRSPLAPDVPTIAENGLPDFEMLSWYAVWAPKNLAPGAMTFLSDQIAAVVNSTDFKDKLTRFGFEPMYRSPADLRAYVAQELGFYEPIMKAAKTKSE